MILHVRGATALASTHYLGTYIRALPVKGLSRGSEIFTWYTFSIDKSKDV